MRNFNVLRFPVFVIAGAAEDAAFAALQSYRAAERELALPVRSRPALAIHADLLLARRVAESLARRAT